MLATFWLLGWALAPAQTTNRPAPPPAAARQGGWVLAPRLSRGQELVYRGSFAEQAAGPRAEFSSTYRFETRLFVLETPPSGADLAVMTSLQSRAGRPAARPEQGASLTRLERVSVDLQGKVSAPPPVPLDGAPTLEVGAFVELPRGRLGVNQTWEVTEAGRPPRSWRVAGTEPVNGQQCVKLVGTQQSGDWDRPRADRPSWRRQDTVWVAARTGLAQRVERVIERREPARFEASQRSVLRYDLESGMQYPAQLAQDRRQEVVQALTYRETAKPLMAEPARNTRQLHALQRRIAYHLDNQPPTPYREAVRQVKAQVDAACRGEVVVADYEEPPPVPAAAAVATVGEPAPDFIAGPVSGKESGRLSRWKGRPVLLVFYQPGSYTAPVLLRFAQEVHAEYGKHVTVVGLTVSDNATEVQKQREALRLGFPVYSGGGMRISYAVESTPKLVLIDAAGVVRGAYHGWGAETASEVMAELRRWLPLR